MSTSGIWPLAFLLTVIAAMAEDSVHGAGQVDGDRPNFLLCISDDQSWCHTSVAGASVVNTPAFDRVARQGALFRHAYCAAPQCAPSRAALLTGRPIWQLEHGGIQRSHLPAKFVSFVDLLETAGYHVGYSGKGWGPGKPGDRKRNAAGPRYRDFSRFLKERPAGKPFCFWFGSSNPHRPHRPAKNRQQRLPKLKVPKFLPDTDVVRNDLLDYMNEINLFDQEVQQHMQWLLVLGERENTLVLITSDNGMPFPRAKCNLYDWGVRMPLAIRWPARVPSGRVVDDFVSFVDFGPTILEAAGIQLPSDMAGRSFLDVLLSDGSGQVDAKRDHVITGRERHSVTRPDRGGYPMRAIRTHEYLYIRNFRPERGPTGTPPGTADLDPSPTAPFMLDHRDDPIIAPFFKLCFLQRPAEELYDLAKDPDQLHNVAGDPAYDKTKHELASRLMEHLRRTADPRVQGDGDVFDKYPFWLRPGEK